MINSLSLKADLILDAWCESCNDHSRKDEVKATDLSAPPSFASSDPYPSSILDSQGPQSPLHWGVLGVITDSSAFIELDGS